MAQAIGNASEKSQHTRTQALQVINEIFMHHCMFYFVDGCRATIINIIEKSLKRGKSPEQALAAKCAALLSIQLEGDGEVVNTIAPILQHIALNKTANFETKAQCCHSLALLHYMRGDDVNDLVVLCQLFEEIFSESYSKKDGLPTTISANAGTVHAAALNAWTLLLTIMPSDDVVWLIENEQILGSFQNFMSLLSSPHLDVRMAAGEAIALLLECGRGRDKNFLNEYTDELVELTKQLATDSQKFRAKRDRKRQRATFRDVLQYVEEDIAPEITIQVGHGITKEQLALKTWSMQHQYNQVCNALGSGMNIHLMDNRKDKNFLFLVITIIFYFLKISFAKFSKSKRESNCKLRHKIH